MHCYCNACYENGVINDPLRHRPDRRRVTSLGEQIAQMFQELRGLKNLSLAEMAEKSGIKAKRIERIEGAQAVPFISELKAMAEALELPLHKIVGEAEDREGRAQKERNETEPGG